MITILIILITIECIKSEDICSFIKPNGEYKGLRIYRHFFDMNGSAEYRLFNRAGDEWRFGLSMHENNQTYYLYTLNKTESKVDVEVVLNKFGVYSGGNVTGFKNCVVKSSEKNIECSGAFKDQGHLYNGTKNDSQSFIDENSIIVASSQSRFLPELVFVFNRFKTYFIRYNPFYMQRVNCTRYPTRCKIPLFIKQMSDELFKRIDGIVTFNLTWTKGGAYGHFILFNIGGRPMMCFTIEGQSLSHECKSTQNLRPLFAECFPTVKLSTVEPTSYSEIWIFVATVIGLLLVIVIIAIIIGCVVFWERRRSLKSLSNSSRF